MYTALEYAISMVGVGRTRGQIANAILRFPGVPAGEDTTAPEEALAIAEAALAAPPATRRAGGALTVRYVLLDLSDVGRADQAFADLVVFLRRIRGAMDLELSVNRNVDDTQAVIKVAYAPEDAAAVAQAFNASGWRGAVLNSWGYDELTEVRALVSDVAWRGEDTPAPGRPNAPSRRS